MMKCMKAVGATWSRFVLNALYSKDPAWLFNPNRDLRAVRRGDLVKVSSRTKPGKTYTVDLEARTCTCKGFEHYGHCWHLEAAEFAIDAENHKEVPAFTGLELRGSEA